MDFTCRITIIDMPGIFKVVANKDNPEINYWYPKGDLNWEFKLQPGYDYIAVKMDDKEPLAFEIAEDGSIKAINIYRHQVDKIL